MSIAVFSDIHGNFPALKAVLEDALAMGATRYYCLGDLTGYYCMINEVIHELRERNVSCVAGNHDIALLHHEGVISRSVTCTRILKRQSELITPANRSYLAALPDSLSFSEGDTRYFAVHGGLEDRVDEYLNDPTEAYFRRNDFREDVLISGHTHIPASKEAGVFRWFNPGSVGQPRDGDPRASYLLIHEGQVSFRRVVYNIDEIADAMKRFGYDAYIYEILYRGVSIGG